MERRAETAAPAAPPPSLKEPYTDGTCSGSSGRGGWGAILKFGEVEKELKSGEAQTTNNRVELIAAISALETLKKPERQRDAISQC